VTLVVIVTATSLRPIADDYCQGSTAVQGYLPSIGTWFSTWGGDLFQIAVTAGIVGQPLALLPFEVASLIPFVLTAIAVVACMVVVARGAVAFEGRPRLWVFGLAVPITMILWWSSWWVSAGVDGTGSVAWLNATALTHWQVVNVQYVLVPMVLTILWVIVDRATTLPWGLKVALLAVLGVAVGLSGLVLGAAALAFVPVLAASRFFLARRVSTRRVVEAGAFAAATAIGLTISFLSPGARARSGDLEPALDPLTPFGLVEWLMPEGVTSWWAGVTAPAVVVVLVATAGASMVAARRGARLDEQRLLARALAVAAFSFTLQLVARLGDAFSYVAYWHDVMPRTLLFFAAALTGIALGSFLGRLRNSFAELLAIGVTVVAISVSVVGIVEMQRTVLGREAAWATGPAPLGAADIEVDWVAECWNDLSDVRDVPERAN
jgi:hypothetical protein